MIHEIALTIKPTMSCNMRCKHCFNGDILNSSEMLELDKVKNFIEAACKKYKDVKITFHGGEPTLAGIEYYKTVFSFQNEMKIKYGTKFSNNFTTNALLLNDELMELLIENNALINISFDGPYNDYLRAYSDIVLDRIMNVKSKGGRTRAFCTISKGSYEHLKDIYLWFSERAIDFKILPIEPRDYAAIDKELLMDIDIFMKNLTETYRYWLLDKNCDIRFYTFEEFADLRRTTQFKPFWFKREIALNPDGKIYPFGRPNDIQFCLGESDDSLDLEACFSSKEYERMIEILQAYREQYCKKCSATMVCNGVCICMSYMYVQDSQLLEYSCNQSRHIFENILDINDEVIEDIRTGNDEKYNEFARNIFMKDIDNYAKSISFKRNQIN